MERGRCEGVVKNGRKKERVKRKRAEVMKMEGRGEIELEGKWRRD